MDRDAERLMAELVSTNAGELSAVARIVVGLVEALKSYPGVAKHVTHSLEEGFAIHNGGSTNPAFLEGYDQLRDHVTALLGTVSGGG